LSNAGLKFRHIQDHGKFAAVFNVNGIPTRFAMHKDRDIHATVLSSNVSIVMDPDYPVEPYEHDMPFIKVVEPEEVSVVPANGGASSCAAVERPKAFTERNVPIIARSAPGYLTFAFHQVKQGGVYNPSNSSGHRVNEEYIKLNEGKHKPLESNNRKGWAEVYPLDPVFVADDPEKNPLKDVLKPEFLPKGLE
jgi:hypothetical protein